MPQEAAALRDFNAACVGLGSFAAGSSPQPSATMSAIPRKRQVTALQRNDAKGQKRTSERSLFGKQTSCTRQHCPNLRKLSELRVDIDRTTMLLDDDVMSDGEPKAGALSGRLCRKERLKHLFSHVGRDAGPIIPYPNFNAIAEISGCGGKCCARRGFLTGLLAPMPRFMSPRRPALTIIHYKISRALY